VVTRVESGGAAERQGLLPGDLLQEAGGVRLGTAADLQAALWDVPQGGSLVLTLVRGGRTVVLHLLPDR
jgi:S1-C subfamily serine protease